MGRLLPVPAEELPWQKGILGFGPVNLGVSDVALWVGVLEVKVGFGSGAHVKSYICSFNEGFALVTKAGPSTGGLKRTALHAGCNNKAVLHLQCKPSVRQSARPKKESCPALTRGLCTP